MLCLPQLGLDTEPRASAHLRGGKTAREQGMCLKTIRHERETEHPGWIEALSLI